MDSIMYVLDAFDGQNNFNVDDLITTAIDEGKTGFLKWAYDNELFKIDEYADYITEYASTETYVAINEIEEMKHDVDTLASLGDLETLEYIYNEFGLHPSRDGYDKARMSDHTNVVNWMNELAADKYYE